MQLTSALYKSILASDNHWFETRLVIDGVGTFDEKDLFSVSTNLEMFRGAPAIGKAVAGEIKVRMLMPSASIPTMATVRPYVRAAGMAAKSSSVTVVGENIICSDASYADGNITINTEVTVSGENIIFPVDSEVYAESEWIPQGVFYIDTREVTQNNDGLDVLTLHGFDAMLKAEQDYSSNAVVGDNYDTAYVSAIAEAIGVSVDNRTWTLMGTGQIIPFPLGYSMREILGYIAAAYVGCFVMTDEGKLRLVSLSELPPETNLLVDQTGDVILFGGDAILV